MVWGSIGMGIVWGWLMVWQAWPLSKELAIWRTAVWLILFTTTLTVGLALLYTSYSAFIFLISTAVGITAHAIAREIILEL